MKLPQLPVSYRSADGDFRNAGFSIYVVEGQSVTCSSVLITDIQNWDFATSATPSQMLELLPGAKYENDFGTVLLALCPHRAHR